MKPNLEMKLTSVDVTAGVEASKEFKQAIRDIVKFYNKHLRKSRKSVRVNSDVQKKVIELAKQIKPIRQLKGKWTCETDQNIESFHSINVEETLKKLTGEQFAEEYDQAMKTLWTMYGKKYGSDNSEVKKQSEKDADDYMARMLKAYER